MHGVDRDLVIGNLDRAAGLLEKRPIPTVRLHAPRSDEDAVFHDNKPDADEAMAARACPNAQTPALL